MSLSPQEKEIVEYGKANGKSLVEVKAALQSYRLSGEAQEHATEEKDVQETTSLMEKVAGGLDMVVGGGKIGEAIGTSRVREQVREGTLEGVTEVDYSQLSPDAIARLKAKGVPTDLASQREETASGITGPTMKQVGGDVLRVASTFTPFGKIAGLVSKGAKAIGIGSKTSNVVGNVTAGGVTGVGADIGTSLAEGGNAKIGLGTYLGAGIPASSPLLGAITRAASKLAGKAGSEVTGALTGTSAETIEQAFLASKTGGAQLDAYTEALRGNTTPESLVNSLRTNVDTVAKQRSDLFKETLKELGDATISTAPAKAQFVQSLEQTGIKINENGLLDFSGSKLRTVPNAQAKLVQAWQEIQRMPETLTLAEVDTTRQAIKAIASISGDEPSANLGNMLIDDAVRSVRTAGEQVEGYGTMLDNFGETSEFLDELQRGLSSGDRATVDQAYRRLATSLKTNNEQRMALVKELDEITGGSTLSGVAGQQLSEALPRGIFRQIAAGIAGGAALTGGVSTSLIPALVFASPRVVGETVRAMGIGTAKADAIISAVADARSVLIKAGAITGAELDASE